MKELKDWCLNKGHNITEYQLGQFARFKENLLDWNKRINLTAITDDKGVWQKHFADSLTLLPYLPCSSDGEMRLIDVGCGAGFPGLPIKIMRSDIYVTMLDSLRKRIFFLEDTVAQLGLEGIECIHDRAEDFSKKEGIRGSYDICTARAVARMDKLCEWCMPFVKSGGLFLAMKGSNTANEISEAMPTIEKLGGKVLDTKFMEIVPGLVHSVVVVCYA